MPNKFTWTKIKIRKCNIPRSTIPHANNIFCRQQICTLEFSFKTYYCGGGCGGWLDGGVPSVPAFPSPALGDLAMPPICWRKLLNNSGFWVWSWETNCCPVSKIDSMLLVFCNDEIMSCMVGSDIKRCAKFVNAGLLKAADKSIFPMLGNAPNGFGAAVLAAVVSMKEN